MFEGNLHWMISSAGGFALTGQFRPVCSIVYEMRDCPPRRAFLRAMDRAFEPDHCRHIALIYRTGRALR